jgi:excisionase family DNA binding protein
MEMALTETAQRAEAYLTPRETARHLRIGVSTTYMLIARGEIPVVRFGTAVRVPLAELERVLAARTETPLVTKS